MELGNGRARLAAELPVPLHRRHPSESPRGLQPLKASRACGGTFSGGGEGMEATGMAGGQRRSHGWHGEACGSGGRVRGGANAARAMESTKPNPLRTAPARIRFRAGTSREMRGRERYEPRRRRIHEHAGGGGLSRALAPYRRWPLHDVQATGWRAWTTRPAATAAKRPHRTARVRSGAVLSRPRHGPGRARRHPRAGPRQGVCGGGLEARERLGNAKPAVDGPRKRTRPAGPSKSEVKQSVAPIFGASEPGAGWVD